ncbi:MAG: DUF1127 domain-containing protein [Rhodospirillales bacterium]
MTNQTNTTAGLPLFETALNVNAMDVQQILEQAKIMRGRVLAGMMASTFKGLKAVIRAQRTARSLNKLSDAVLADIGIERSQIPSISKALANGTYAQPTAEVTVIAPAEAVHDDHQQELPLAA